MSRRVYPGTVPAKAWGLGRFYAGADHLSVADLLAAAAKARRRGDRIAARDCVIRARFTRLAQARASERWRGYGGRRTAPPAGFFQEAAGWLGRRAPA